jgi:halocyanin-like protein
MNSNEADRTRTSDSSVTLSRADRTQNNVSGTPGFGRRKFLSAAGSVSVAGLIAGCTSDNSGSGGNTGATDGSDGGGENAGTGNSSGSSSVNDWLAETDNYDGSVTDMIDKTAVTVKAGPESNEYVFAPAAIRINSGTTITWEWIGSGRHNVVATDGQFKSGEPEKKATYKHTFETTETALYYCTPHKSMGMKGAVIVEKGGDNESSGNTTGNGTANA